MEINELWGSVSDLQVLHDIICMEDQEHMLSGMSNSQLLHDVTVIESSLDGLLQQNSLPR